MQTIITINQDKSVASGTKFVSDVFTIPDGTTYMGVRLAVASVTDNALLVTRQPLRMSLEVSLDGKTWDGAGGCGIAFNDNTEPMPGFLASFPREWLGAKGLQARATIDSDIDVRGDIKITFDDKALQLSASELPHSVAYDSQATNIGFGVTTLTTATFTITASANRAALIGLSFLTDITGNTFSTISCSAVTGTAIASGAIWDASAVVGCKAFQVIAPTNGATKSATLTWSTSATAEIGVMTASGVDQTTPFNGVGTGSKTDLTPISLSVTSTNGDLTATILGDNAGSTGATSNQTRKVAGSVIGMDVGPGTGSTTHTWTHSSSKFTIVGVNFVSSGGGGATISMIPTALSLGVGL